MYMINNRILTKICGSGSEKVRGGRRKLHDKDFDESHCLSNDNNKMKYKCFVRGKMSVAKINIRWEDCIYMAQGIC